MYKRIKMYDSTGLPLESVSQWDVNRVIMIPDISMEENHSYSIQFASCKSGAAYVVIPNIEDDVEVYENGEAEPTEKDDVLVAVLPNQLTVSPHVVRIYIYEEDDETGERKTVGMVMLPVVKRCEPAPDNYDVAGDIISVANGLIVEDDMIYLARDRRKFGNGVDLAGLQGVGATAGLTIPQLYGAAADAAGITTIIEEGTA